ncbi:hypothetical protein RvY_17371 [Ramazzottius varieornatus]|uniref:Uncharacterized protein n=1 Tax=Ramazzottius varieornatus TaxID=947166 RepID=A0A1D1W1W6_RAMVA|nr:hypothetical protein RvY_17371 [Ramazzottius varieornatus]
MPRTKVNNARITHRMGGAFRPGNAIRLQIARLDPALAVGVPVNPARAAPDSARNATVVSPVRVHRTIIVTIQTHPAQVKVEPSPLKRPFPDVIEF